VVCRAVGELVALYREVASRRRVLVAGSRGRTGSSCHARVQCGAWYQARASSSVQKVVLTGVLLYITLSSMERLIGVSKVAGVPSGVAGVSSVAGRFKGWGCGFGGLSSWISSGLG